MDFEKNDVQLVKFDGFIEKGKQFDVEVSMPEDDRNVVFGIIKDHFREPVKDAVVKLIEVRREYGKEERLPVSHTFTNKHGEFVFGPLCPDKKYEVLFWADRVKHIKVCAECEREGECLKGVELRPCKPECKCERECECERCREKEDCKEDCKKDCKEDCKKDCKEDCKDDCKKEREDECDRKDECKKDCKEECKKECKEDVKKNCRPGHFGY